MTNSVLMKRFADLRKSCQRFVQAYLDLNHMRTIAGDRCKKIIKQFTESDRWNVNTRVINHCFAVIVLFIHLLPAIKNPYAPAENFNGCAGVVYCRRKRSRRNFRQNRKTKTWILIKGTLTGNRKC